MNLRKYLERLHDSLVKAEKGGNRFKVLSNYYGTYIQKEIEKQEQTVSGIFRVFEPAKPSRGRKLNVDPKHGFDPLSDSLMDYATIVAHKLGGSWEEYNRLISVQIPCCPNDCWHCYLPKVLYDEDALQSRYEEMTASEIVEGFLRQRGQDATSGKASNVLRLTGGEPFLLPELILDCLRELEGRGLCSTIALWTETNLEPFIRHSGKSFMDSGQNPAILEQLSQYGNLIVHPCIHGLDQDEFQIITGRSYRVSLRDQLEAIRMLVETGLDVYPTVGSNVCDASNLEALFNGLVDIHEALPLRLALVNYSLDYPPIRERLERISNTAGNRGLPNLYSHFSAIRLWNELLLGHFGIGYGIMPRHTINLKEWISNSYHSAKSVIISKGSEHLYLFKSSYRDLYHREVLDILAYPFGHCYSMCFDKRWVQEDLLHHASCVPELYSEKCGILFYVDKDSRRVMPLRKFRVKEITTSHEWFKIVFELREYVNLICETNEDVKEKITEKFSEYFGKRNMPPGGKYLLLGEKMLEDNTVSHSRENEQFIFGGFGIRDMSARVSIDTKEFNGVVGSLAEGPRMKNSLFYRVLTQGIEVKRDKKNKQEVVYHIRAGKSFQLSLEYFLPNYNEFAEGETSARTVRCELSSNSIELVGPSSVVFSKYGNASLRFRTLNKGRGERVALIIYGEKDEFSSARIELVIQIDPPIILNSVFTMLSAFSAFLGTIAISYFVWVFQEGKKLDIAYIVIGFVSFLLCFVFANAMRSKGYGEGLT